MISSGINPIATANDNPVDLISAAEQRGMRRVVLINEDGVPGSFTLDGGVTFCHWPNGATFIDLPLPAPLIAGQAVQFKRIASGANATKLYAWGY